MDSYSHAAMQTPSTAAAALAIATAIVGFGCRSADRSRPASRPISTVAPSSQPTIAQVRELFYRAVEGDAEALRQCESTLSSLPVRDAKVDAKVKAYRGACEMLRAEQARWPWEKGRHAEAGLRLLDAAVDDAPSDPEVRFVRGMTSYNLPPVFARGDVAAADLGEVAARAEAVAADGTLDAPLAAAALYHYGELRQRAGDEALAIDLWRRAIDLAPETRAAVRSESKLNAALNARRSTPRQ